MRRKNNNQLNISIWKVILSISAMLLVGSVAVAQSNGYSNQMGTANDAFSGSSWIV
jgi:hypothetical protein